MRKTRGETKFRVEEHLKNLIVERHLRYPRG